MSDKQSASMTLPIHPKENNSSKKSKAEPSMTLNSYLYGKPDVVERLTQGHRTTVDGYRNRAAGHIMDFERAFAGDGSGKTKYQARI